MAVDESNDHVMSVWDWQKTDRGQRVTEVKVIVSPSHSVCLSVCVCISMCVYVCLSVWEWQKMDRGKRIAELW